MMLDDQDGILVINRMGVQLSQGSFDQALLVRRIHKDQVKEDPSLFKKSDGSVCIDGKDLRPFRQPELFDISLNEPEGALIFVNKDHFLRAPAEGFNP